MDESFLPYAMIEPLLEEGMTIRALGEVIEARLGVSHDRYGLVFAQPRATFIESLRGGVRLVKRDSEEFKNAPRLRLNEPVR